MLADLVRRRVAVGLVGKHSSGRPSARAAISGFSESQRDGQAAAGSDAASRIRGRSLGEAGCSQWQARFRRLR